MAPVAGAAIGEIGDLRPAEIGARAVVAFTFLVVVGSVLACTALVWLLQRVPTSTVATYAYVNPVIALAGAAVVLGSVVVVVSRSSGPVDRKAPATGHGPAAARP